MKLKNLNLNVANAHKTKFIPFSISWLQSLFLYPLADYVGLREDYVGYYAIIVNVIKIGNEL